MTFASSARSAVLAKAWSAARLLCVGVVLAMASLPGGRADPGRAQAAETSRPNIVLFVADDMTWTDSSAYGSPNIKTPNIDRLASQGMLFKRAFQSTAMCAVTRQQLYTGLDPVRSGAYPQHSWTDPGTKSVFAYLKELGYRVALSGKTHIGPRENYPYEFLGDEHAGGGISENLPPLDFDAVQSFMRRDPKQPFFVVLASHRPHVPWTQGDASKFDPAALRLPPYLADTPVLRKLLTHYYAAVQVLDDEVGRVDALLRSSGLQDNTLFLFTSEQGSSVPFAKWTLYDAGVRTELIARWPGHVKAGSHTNAMVSYEDVTPTLIAAAGGRPPAGLDGRSFADVLAGGVSGGRRLVYGIHTNAGIIGGDPYPIRSVRDARYKLIRNLNPDAAYGNILTSSTDNGGLFQDWEAAARAGDAVAAERVKAYRHRPPVELYDLQTDPFELHNRADDAELKGVRAGLQRELDSWMKRQGDTGMPLELSAYSHINPAILRLITERYPNAMRNPAAAPIKP